jgi:glycosyltransferase involved in cell wall biosynthesis
MYRVGIAVSTYTENNTDSSRYDIIDKSLNSLIEYMNNSTLLTVFAIIVVDGPIPVKHQNILDKYSNNPLIKIHYRKDNGGVARTKNTCIRLLMDENIDYGFLMDDDILYKTHCIEQYIQSMKETGINHMGFCQMPEMVHPKNEWDKMGYCEVKMNNYPIMKHVGSGVGCLLSFTPELINKIGYFKVMPGKYGYEHINFTYRAIHQGVIPFASDIVNSNNYIEHIGFEPVCYNKFNKCHSISENYRKSENEKNKKLWNQDLDKVEPCIE